EAQARQGAASRREAQARQGAASRREAQARQGAASRREAQARQGAASRREAQARQGAASRREAQARQGAASRREAQARQGAASRKDVSTGHDNLYVASIVAVNVDTGELKCNYQRVPGDEWDYDSVQQMILADLNINGRTRKVIMQANKNGFFYVLDRITGEFISAQPFSRVTWAMGIDQKTGRPIINTEVKYGEDPVPVSPGGGGAHNWSPMSYNSQTGLVYIPSRGWDTFTYATDYGFKPDPNRAGGAGQTGLNLNTRGVTPKPTGPAIGPEPLENGALSTLVAYDPVKQEIRWRVPVGNSRYGGTVTTASNLVFQVAPDGRLI